MASKSFCDFCQDEEKEIEMTIKGMKYKAGIFISRDTTGMSKEEKEAMWEETDHRSPDMCWNCFDIHRDNTV